MHFIRPTVVCLFGLVGLASSTRATSKIKVDWQPISREDLALKDNPAFHGDDAMILYREVVIDDWNLSMTEYIRIKIFTEEGRKWADVQVPFVPGFWEIKELRARTIHPDGTITDFKGQTFDALVVKARGVKVRLRKFSLPDVQPGCIIEYIYEHHGPLSPRRLDDSDRSLHPAQCLYLSIFGTDQVHLAMEGAPITSWVHRAAKAE